MTVAAAGAGEAAPSIEGPEPADDEAEVEAKADEPEVEAVEPKAEAVEDEPAAEPAA